MQQVHGNEGLFFVCISPLSELHQISTQSFDHCAQRPASDTISPAGCAIHGTDKGIHVEIVTPNLALASLHLEHSEAGQVYVSLIRGLKVLSIKKTFRLHNQVDNRCLTDVNTLVPIHTLAERSSARMEQLIPRPVGVRHTKFTA